jgi:hypothetical protein
MRLMFFCLCCYAPPDRMTVKLVFDHLEFPSDLCLAAQESVLGSCQSLYFPGERMPLLTRTALTIPKSHSVESE